MKLKSFTIILALLVFVGAQVARQTYSDGVHIKHLADARIVKYAATVSPEPQITSSNIIKIPNAFPPSKKLNSDAIAQLLIKNGGAISSKALDFN